MGKKDILNHRRLLDKVKTRRPPRFNPEQVDQIRSEYLNNDTNHDKLARNYSCSKELIRNVLGYIGIYGEYPYKGKDKKED